MLRANRHYIPGYVWHITHRCHKKAMAAGEYEGLDKGLEVKAEGSARVRETKDPMEGFNAFLEKRKPVFTGE